MTANRLVWVGRCLEVLNDPSPLTAEQIRAHGTLVAKEYERHTKAGQFAQADMFKHTTGAKA